MKLATFEVVGGRHVGVVDSDDVVDLTVADPTLSTMIDLLERGPQRVVASFASAPRLAPSSVKLAPPVPRPPKFLAIGYNYTEHLKETQMARPTRQVWFNKQQTCIVGPDDPCRFPRSLPTKSTTKANWAS
jgi:2-keto-4-pentenoate hydratase/2-oxohepta-3-ene-1,7-dioic acid hydratase in catechol pathway